MGFTSALPPVFISANKIADKIAKLPHRNPNKRPLPPWDPTECSVAERDDIRVAFSALKVTYIPAIEAIGYDWKKLADLMKTQTIDPLNITCDTREGYPNITSNVRYKSLNFNLNTSNTSLLDAWLLVAIIRLCGGTDLDAWAIKNFFFSIIRGSGGTTYNQVLPSELALMCAGSKPVPVTPPYRAGQFTCWDNVNGVLYASNRAAANAYNPVPAGGNPVFPHGNPQSGYWQWHCPVTP